VDEELEVLEVKVAVSDVVEVLLVDDVAVSVTTLQVSHMTGQSCRAKSLNA
jgi:hypothetical protein